MGRTYQLIALALSAAVCTACAGSPSQLDQPAGAQPEDPAALTLDLARTRPTGQGPAFRPAPISTVGVAAGRPVGPLRCVAGRSAVYGAHIELFASGRGIQVPAGIGIPGSRHQGAFAVGGRCRYGLSTADPTGVVQVRQQGQTHLPTVGQLFRLWGQALSPQRLASFTGPVRAYLDGRRWPGDPRDIPLRRHAQVVLEVGPPVPPHPFYLFPPQL